MPFLPTNRGIWVVLWILSMQTTYAFVVVRSFSKAGLTLPTSLPAAQLLEFVEPETRVKVILVGAMHYNPYSVRLAKDTIERLGMANQPGSVVILETPAKLRWNKAAEMYMY